MTVHLLAGCHDTGKTGNVDINFSRQEKHRICLKVLKYFLHNVFTSNMENFNIFKLQDIARLEWDKTEMCQLFKQIFEVIATCSIAFVIVI